VRTKKGYKYKCINEYSLSSFLSQLPLRIYAYAAPVLLAPKFPRLSWLESVKPETSILGTTAAPLATTGVVGTGTAADDIGSTPTTPPKAPLSAIAVGTAASAAPPRFSVLLSELATPGRGASVELEAAAGVTDAGAPTMGTDEGSARLGGVWRDAADEEEERPGGAASPDD
jgi:hypothetical protein